MEEKKLYPGTLFLVVGNSGSGKDSIINGVVEKNASNSKKIIAARRYITRPSSVTENNFFISPIEFQELANQGKFALKWHIYGLDYGVPIEIEKWLEEGHFVIANVSRTIIDVAKKKYKNIKVIFVEVPFKTILKRLKGRAREDNNRLKERIERAKKNKSFSEADLIVDNSKNLEHAVNQVLEYIRKVILTKENK